MSARQQPRASTPGSPSSRRWSATAGSTRSIVAITDMQGRLMGKRVQAQAFLERRHRPRRALLHVPAGHGHGDEHARRLRADELGDRLRRLDRRPGLGHAARPALAREDGARPRATRSTRRPAQEIPISPRTILKRQVERAAERGLRGQGRLRVRVLRADGHLRGAGRARATSASSASATTTRTTTCSRRPRPSRSTACCATR